MNKTYKRIADLKAGDMVAAHGAVFRVIEDAKESQAHRDRYWVNGYPTGHHVFLEGPTDCAYCRVEWVSGEIVRGYFGPDKGWTFQGSHAVTVQVIQ